MTDRSSGNISSEKVSGGSADLNTAWNNLRKILDTAPDNVKHEFVQFCSNVRNYNDIQTLLKNYQSMGIGSGGGGTTKR